jgi:AraC family transcriptional regulator
VETKLATGSFYGQTVQSRTLGGWGFSESVYPAGAQIERHTHESAFFYLVVAGVCREDYAHGSRVSEPASLVFHPAGEPHANHWHGAGDGRCFNIEADPARLTALREYAPILDRPADFPGGTPSHLAARLYREFQHMDALSPLAMEGLMLELLAEASRTTVPDHAERVPPRWLREARELLNAHGRETPSLEGVAGAVGVHPSHLARAFRQQFHCSVGDYVRQIRIERACRLLSASETPLAEIALDLGFADQSHLCKTFKRAIGVTPAAFRRTHRLCNSDTSK